MKHPSSPLISAIKRGDQATARRLVREGHLNEIDSQGWTPLEHAAFRGDVNMIGMLIDAGADPNCGKETGFAAVSCAVLKGHPEAIRVLRSAGAHLTPEEVVKLRGFAAYPPQIDSAKTREQILRVLEEWS